MHFHVTLEVGQQAESLATLGTAVTPHLGVGVQSEGVRKSLEAQGAVVEALGVSFLVGEERASVAV